VASDKYKHSSLHLLGSFLKSVFVFLYLRSFNRFKKLNAKRKLSTVSTPVTAAFCGSYNSGLFKKFEGNLEYNNRLVSERQKCLL